MLLTELKVKSIIRNFESTNYDINEFYDDLKSFRMCDTNNPNDAKSIHLIQMYARSIIFVHYLKKENERSKQLISLLSKYRYQSKTASTRISKEQYDIAHQTRYLPSYENISKKLFIKCSKFYSKRCFGWYLNTQIEPLLRMLDAK